jgi:hypothetical protein
MKVRILRNSVKFYLPRLEGYLETVRTIADKYGSMSLVELVGYFEGKFEPVKYTRVEIHTNELVEEKITDFANKIRIKLNQTSLAYEFNNQLLLVSNLSSINFLKSIFRTVFAISLRSIAYVE